MLCLSFEDCLILPIIMNLRMFVHIFQVLQSYGLLNIPNDPFEGGGAEVGRGWGWVMGDRKGVVAGALCMYCVRVAVFVVVLCCCC